MGGGLDELLGQLFRDLGAGWGRPKGPTIHVDLELSLGELYLGGNHTVKYQRKEPTGTVRQVVVLNQMGPITIQEVRMVPEFRTIDMTYDFVLEPGRDPDIPIVVDFEEYSLSIKLKELPHPVFTRRGIDLETTLTITLREALLGFQRSIMGLSGTLIEIICKSVVTPTTVKFLEGEGYSGTGEGGRLFVKFNVEFPKELSEEDRKILETCVLAP